MMRRLFCAAIILSSGMIAAPASAQSLAEVARQEEARRKSPAAKKAVKSFSNADLAPSEIAPPPSAVAPPPAGCVTSVKEGKCVEPEKVISNSNAEATQADPQIKTSEATIRRQAEIIRQRLLKAQQEFAAISSSADDPNRSAGERAAAARMAAQRETMLASIEKSWYALEKQVTDEELPRDWLQPVPPLSPRRPQ